MLTKARSLLGIGYNKLVYSKYNLRMNDLTLKTYKNNHKDKRCFLIGTGPSMKNVDTSLLEHEYTVGVNMLYVTGLKTTFYFVCGHNILKKRGNEVIMLPNLFLGGSAGRYYLKHKKAFSSYLKHRPNVTHRPLVLRDYGEISVWNNISSNIIKGVRGGLTVSLVALQVLLYMGFKEVYLLGHDCDYTTNGQYFFENLTDCTERPWDIIFRNYEIVGRAYERRGSKIYNLTEGSKLSAFEMMKLEEVIYAEH